MSIKEPHRTHDRWLREGQKLIADMREEHYGGNPRATDEDGAFDVLKAVAYALVHVGCEQLDRIFEDALEDARFEYSNLAYHMARMEGET